MTKFQWTLNISEVRGKHRGGDFRPLTLARYWQPQTTGWDEFIERVVTGGMAWTAAALAGNRSKANVRGAQLVGIDVDHGMSVAEAIAHPIVSAHAALIYPSPSHQLPGKGDRFRIVFRLPHPITDVGTYEAIVAWLIAEIGSADPSTKDASRLWYGALPGSEPLYRRDDAELGDEVITTIAQQVAEREAAAREARERAKAERAARLAQRQAVGFDASSVTYIPLEVILPRADRDCLAAGSIAGQRNSDGARLSRALLGAEQWLQAEGYTTDQPESLFRQWAAASGLAERETNTLWRSACGSNPSPSLPDEAAHNCVMAFRWKQGDRSRESQSWQASAPAKAKPVVLPAVGGDGTRWYGEGERLATWQASTKQVVLDRSGTGLGKGYDAGLLVPEQFGAKDAFFVSCDHRNPSTATLASWIDVPGRHAGLSHRQAPDGTERTERTKPGATPSIAPNCSRNHTIAALRDRGLTGIDSASLICQKCPLREMCAHSQGNGYGFLWHRKTALMAQRKRIHPQSLPGSDHDYSASILIYDEPDRMPLLTEVTITAADVAQLRGLPQIDAYPTVRAILGALHGVLTSPAGYYGLGHHEIVSKLGIDATPNHLEIEQLRAILEPDLSALDPAAEYGVALEDLPPQVRRKLADSDTQIATKIAALPKQWLAGFLRAIAGVEGYHLSLSSWGALAITRPDFSSFRRALLAKKAIFTSATMSREHLARILGIEPEAIDVVAQRNGAQRCKIVQLTGLGRLPRTRTPAQQARIDAISAAIAPDITIDYKSQSTAAAWHRDTVGSNAFAAAAVVLAIGTPCPNLHALAAQFTALYGKPPSTDSEAFTGFVNGAIASEYQQCLGRKAERRGREGDTLYVLSDWEGIPALGERMGFTVTTTAATTITAAAASKGEATTRKVIGAMVAAAKSGAAATTEAIATQVGISKGRVSQIAKDLGSSVGAGFSQIRDCLVFLYMGSNSKTKQADPSLVEWVINILKDLECGFMGGQRTESNFVANVANALSWLAGDVEALHEALVGYLRILDPNRREAREALLRAALSPGGSIALKIAM